MFPTIPGIKAAFSRALVNSYLIIGQSVILLRQVIGRTSKHNLEANPDAVRASPWTIVRQKVLKEIHHAASTVVVWWCPYG